MNNWSAMSGKTLSGVYIICVRRAHAPDFLLRATGARTCTRAGQNRPQTRSHKPFVCVHAPHAPARIFACVRAYLYKVRSTSARRVGRISGKQAGRPERQ